ncbi:MAG: DUF4381 domain-containing protein [Alphaproteobacteria bacterium]
MPTTAVSLSDLRDIHLPEEISIFPLAYGWWLVLGIVILLILSPWFIKSFNKIYALTLRKKALRELLELEKRYNQNNDFQALASAVSRLIKRIALLNYDKEYIAKLYDKSWADFLVKTGFNNPDLAQTISCAAYLNKDNFSCKTNNIVLLELTKKWIRQNT